MKKIIGFALALFAASVVHAVQPGPIPAGHNYINTGTKIQTTSTLVVYSSQTPGAFYLSTTTTGQPLSLSVDSTGIRLYDLNFINFITGPTIESPNANEIDLKIGGNLKARLTPSTFTVFGMIETSTGGVKFPDGSIQTVAASTAGGGGGSSIYPATATASFPYGLTASTVTASGNVYIATTSATSSTATLTVNGGVASMAGGYQFPDGTWQTTAASGGGSGGLVDPATSTRSFPYGFGSTTYWGQPGDGTAAVNLFGDTRNTAVGYMSAVIGGFFNAASGAYSVILGGFANIASGSGSVVVGGRQNTASGSFSLAAGRLATASNNQAFVWSDGTVFSSSADNQFAAHATNGFWFSGGAVRMDNYGAGAATFDANGNLSSVSDEHAKERIRPFSLGLESVVKLHPVKYRYNKESGLDRTNDYTGFTTQDVEKSIPEAVFHSKNGYSTLWDRAILAAVVNSVKELKKENDDLKARMEKLERK